MTASRLCLILFMLNLASVVIGERFDFFFCHHDPAILYILRRGVHQVQGVNHSGHCLTMENIIM